MNKVKYNYFVILIYNYIFFRLFMVCQSVKIFIISTVKKQENPNELYYCVIFCNFVYQKNLEHIDKHKY